MIDHDSELVPPELQRRVEILELFAEHSATVKPRALIATGWERVGNRARLRLDGFAVFREWERYGSFLERREAEEQRELDRRARLKASMARRHACYTARHYERERASKRADDARRHAAMTPEQRAVWLEKVREWKRRRELRKLQAAKLAAWKSAPRPMTAQRVAALPEGPERERLERRRAQRAAQAQRHRDRMTPEQREAERAAARARKRR